MGGPVKLVKAEAQRPATVDQVIDFMVANGADPWTIRVGPVTDQGRRYLIGQTAKDRQVELMVTFRPLEA
jgi:hypothetical protein